jgi:hypothetical protein
VAFAAIGGRRDPGVIDVLRRQRLIHGIGDPYGGQIEAYHDRVREVAIAKLAPARLRELHRSLAVALEACGIVEPEALARHYRAAADIVPAIEWTRHAARAATGALAFTRAEELYQELARLPLDANQRAEVLDELAAAQVLAGRRTNAGATCIEAAELARVLDQPARMVALRARAGEHLLLGGQLERGLELLQSALHEVGVALPSEPAVAVAESFNLGGSLAVRGLGYVAHTAADVDSALLRRIDLELEVARALMLTDLRGALVATHALRDALDAGEPHRLLRALACFVITNVSRAPDYPLVDEALRSARVLAVELGDDVAIAWAALAEGIHGMVREEHVTALEALARAARQFISLGPVHAREAAISRIAIICGNFGVDVSFARRANDECVDDARERDDQFAGTWATLSRCWLQLLDDAPAAARRSLAAARNVWPRVADSLFAVASLTNEVAIDLYEAPATAWGTVERIAPEFFRLFSSLLPYPRIMFGRLAANAALAAFHAGAATRAETLARIERHVGALDGLTIGRASQAILHSHVRLLAGDRRASLEQLQEAAEIWARSRQRVHELTTRLRIHQLIDDRDQVAELRHQLRGLTIADPDRLATLFPGPRAPG